MFLSIGGNESLSVLLPKLLEILLFLFVILISLISTPLSQIIIEKGGGGCGGNNSSRIMIIIEIYNISLLLISKPTNSCPPLILTQIGNEKCVRV